jgi:dihydrolipoamide dehydrogenase
MSTTEMFDIAIIGAGPGGYVSAIKASQLGKKVVLIEKTNLGGTCLNIGCIPTKTLLSSASVLHQIKRAAEFGIQTGPVSIAYNKMKERKDGVIRKIRSGLEALLKSHKITIYQGTAQFCSPHELKVTGEYNGLIRAPKIIIATGSVPIDVKTFPCDHERILNSTSILELTEIPKTLAIIGGGYIGCEFASLFAELGTKVTILEALPSILVAQGASIAQFMTQTFKNKGIEIKTNVMVENIKNKKTHTHITLSDKTTLDTDLSLVAIGRKPYTDHLGLDKACLKLSDKGFINVDDRMETEVKGLFAIGDVTGKAMLAHVASHQGIIAAMNACDMPSHAHYDAVPSVIFTSPEVATVGITLEQAIEKGIAVAQAKFPFLAIGKAQASGESEGYSQIIADKKTGQILGATIIGHDASNLIAEMTLAVQNELTLDCVLETIHAHPTMAEIWHESAAMALGMPIHLNKK